MKKTVAVILFGSLIFAGCSSSTTPTPSASPTTQTSDTSTYTAADVAKHSTSSDCWLIIDGKVYNATSYLSRHEGGADVIISQCGKDASSAFHTQGGRGTDHPARANRDLASLEVGTLQQ